jgi:nicotinate phosphoribosyltransferase
VENAIKYGKTVNAIRLDSGDLYNLSVNSRRLLTNYNQYTTKIVATNDLDEYSITDLIQKGAPIDSFGVGTQLVSTPDCPSFGFVHKLIEVDGRAVAKKADGSKGTWPGKKQVWRTVSPYKNTTVMTQDTISTFSENSPSECAVPMVQQYAIAKTNPKDIEQARHFFKETLAILPPYMKTIPRKPIVQEQAGKIEYPVQFSNGLIHLKNITNA